MSGGGISLTRVLGWGTAPASTQEARTFFQRRLSLYAFLVFVLSGIFVPILLGIDLLSERELSAWSVEVFNPFHLSGTLMSGAVWLALRRAAEYSRRTLEIVDLVYTLAVCMVWVAMGFSADEHVHIEFFLMLAWTNTVITRSAFVPSSAKRTLGVCLVATAAVLVGTVALHLRGAQPDPWREIAAYTVATFTWCVVAVTVAVTVSAVTYGLRRQVEEARKVGQYVLEEEIGRGGMGVVYRARHAMLRRSTAIKLISGSDVDEIQAQRFEREVQSTAALAHPNIVAVYDYGRTPAGVFYYAMEYLDGLSLADLVRLHGPVGPSRAVHLLVQVCNGLAEAHDHELIHRDIKPQNVMLVHSRAAPDLVKVLDFGLVKSTGEKAPDLTVADTLQGTPQYISPETVLDGVADARSDLYAVGCVAYYLLTGTPVFPKSSPMALCAQHVHTPPEPLSQRCGQPLPAELEALVLQCLDKDATKRPRDAHELAEALLCCDVGASWTARDAQRWWDTRPTVRSADGEEITRTLDPLGRTVQIDLEQR